MTGVHAGGARLAGPTEGALPRWERASSLLFLSALLGLFLWLTPEPERLQDAASTFVTRFLATLQQLILQS